MHSLSAGHLHLGANGAASIFRSLNFKISNLQVFFEEIPDRRKLKLFRLREAPGKTFTYLIKGH